MQVLPVNINRTNSINSKYSRESGIQNFTANYDKFTQSNSMPAVKALSYEYHIVLKPFLSESREDYNNINKIRKNLNAVAKEIADMEYSVNVKCEVRKLADEMYNAVKRSGFPDNGNKERYENNINLYNELCNNGYSVIGSDIDAIFPEELEVYNKISNEYFSYRSEATEILDSLRRTPLTREYRQRERNYHREIAQADNLAEIIPYKEASILLSEVYSFLQKADETDIYTDTDALNREAIELSNKLKPLKKQIKEYHASKDMISEFIASHPGNKSNTMTYDFIEKYFEDKNDMNDEAFKEMYDKLNNYYEKHKNVFEKEVNVEELLNKQEEALEALQDSIETVDYGCHDDY